MNATTLDPSIRAQIEGDAYGPVAAGKYVVQVGSVHGGHVEINQQGPPAREPRPRPVRELPRPFPGLLGRQDEVEQLTTVLGAQEVVELTGVPGIGKTSLVQHVAHEVSPLPDGIVHRAVGPRPLEDLLQLIYDAFFTSRIPAKLRMGELASALNGIRAQIFLDDLDLSREEVGALLNALPSCSLLYVSTERQLWGGSGRSLALTGLPPAGALTLVAQTLGRNLAEAERQPAQALVALLDGHPLNLIRAASRVREEGISIAQLVHRLQAGRPEQAVTRAVLSSLSGRERQVAAVLGALEGTPLDQEHLEAISAPLATLLEKMMERGVIQAHSPRYSLSGELGDALPAEWLTPMREWLLGYFVQWAQAHRDAPERLLRDAPAMVRLLEWAIEAGRWTEALTLIQVIEPVLALDRQWKTAGRLLDWALQAARASGAAAAEGWALHQQGTYALCLDQPQVARRALQEALRTRERLGDEVGAALTRHNLSLLAPPPPSPPRPGPEPEPGKPGSPLRPFLIGAGVLGVLGVLLLGLLFVIPNVIPPTDGPGEPIAPIEPVEPGAELPDLVIEEWGALGEPFFADNGVFTLPAVMAVQNVGEAEAGPFFVAVESVRGPCDPVLPFFVERQGAFAEIEGLAPGEAVALEGMIPLFGAEPGATCALVAIADSREPEPDLPPPGRVREADEDNNRAGPFSVTIPAEGEDEASMVQIESPQEGELFGYDAFDEKANRWYAVVPLVATAFDEEDGELPPQALFWQTDRDDLQEPFLGQGNAFEVRLYGTEDQCSVRTHQITVVATDSAGNEVQATVSVELHTIC